MKYICICFFTGKKTTESNFRRLCYENGVKWLLKVSCEQTLNIICRRKRSRMLWRMRPYCPIYKGLKFVWRWNWIYVTYELCPLRSGASRLLTLSERCHPEWACIQRTQRLVIPVVLIVWRLWARGSSGGLVQGYQRSVKIILGDTTLEYKFILFIYNVDRGTSSSIYYICWITETVTS
jgi:hypothetical protein